MYLLNATETGVDALRSRLGALGDSLVVVGGDPLWNVHVHVDDAGAAVEAALEVGRPHRIRITHLQTQAPEPKGGRSLVVVVHGPGVATMLADSGAVVVPAEPTRRPSTREILDAIDRCDGSDVIVLPSDRDTCAVAEAAAEEARVQGHRVAVIPTRSMVQSLAAVAVHEPNALFEDDVIAMTRAASATHYGAITIAAREALTSMGECRAGDVLGLADGDIVHIGSDPYAVAQAVIERMLTTGSELVTLVAGLDSAGIPEALETWLARTHPGIDMVVYEGGQPLWPLIIGVE
jgi:dihydroxyacetone kinase-like predicted kinase